MRNSGQKFSNLSFQSSQVLKFEKDLTFQKDKTIKRKQKSSQIFNQTQVQLEASQEKYKQQSIDQNQDDFYQVDSLYKNIKTIKTKSDNENNFRQTETKFDIKCQDITSNNNIPLNSNRFSQFNSTIDKTQQDLSLQNKQQGSLKSQKSQTQQLNFNSNTNNRNKLNKLKHYKSSTNFNTSNNKHKTNLLPVLSTTTNNIQDFNQDPKKSLETENKKEKEKEKKAAYHKKILSRHRSIQEEMFRIDKDDMFQLCQDNENQVTKYIKQLILQSEDNDQPAMIERVKQECRNDNSQIQQIKHKLKTLRKEQEINNTRNESNNQQNHNSWFVGPQNRFKNKKKKSKYLFSSNDDFYKNLYYYQNKDTRTESKQAKDTRQSQEKKLDTVFSRLEHSQFVNNYLNHLKSHSLRPSHIFNKSFQQEFRLSQQSTKYRRDNKI